MSLDFSRTLVILYTCALRYTAVQWIQPCCDSPPHKAETTGLCRFANHRHSGVSALYLPSEDGGSTGPPSALGAGGQGPIET